MSVTEVKVKIGLDGVPQLQAGVQQAAQAMQGLNIGTKTLGQNAQLSGQQTAQLSVLAQTRRASAPRLVWWARWVMPTWPARGSRKPSAAAWR